MNDRISITMLEDGIADVRMTRVDKMNALDSAQWTALVEAVETLKAMSGLRVVVLSGEGRAFCAGLDLSSMQSDREPGGSSAGGSLADRTHGIANNAQYAAWGWRELPVPVIAAVHGVAFGAGSQIMAAADIRIAHAMELARVIANKNPHAIRGAKRLCNLMGDATDAELLQAESDEQVLVIRKPNQMEAVMASMEKRKPNFVE
jgi:enoyl-CoA hydratase/carnithine racemase